MIHKDRDFLSGNLDERAQATIPFDSLLGTLARRVQPLAAMPLPPPAVPPRVAKPVTPLQSSSLSGKGVGLVVQSITATYQRTRSWRRTAFQLRVPLAQLREWVHEHVADFGILGSEALTGLFNRKPRLYTREVIAPAPPLVLQQPAPTPAQPASTHWSGLRLNRDVAKAVADFCQRRGIDERVYFHDVFDAMTLQETADLIGIGTGVLEELIRTASGLLVNHAVYEMLRKARGEQSLSTFLESKFNPDRIDTIARELNVSTQVFMHLIQSFCPLLLQNATV